MGLWRIVLPSKNEKNSICSLWELPWHQTHNRCKLKYSHFQFNAMQMLKESLSSASRLRSVIVTTRFVLQWNKSRKTDRNPCLSHKTSAQEGSLLFVVSSEKETLSSPQIIPVTFFTATHNTQQIFRFAVIPDVKWRTETIDKGMKRRGEERVRGRGEMGGWQQVWWRLKESNTKLILHFPSFRPCLLR